MPVAAVPAGGRRIVVVGTSGNAHDILDILDALSARGDTWDLAGFMDDAKPVGSTHLGVPILGCLRDAASMAAQDAPLADAMFVNAIASERTHRRKLDIIAGLALAPDRFPALVHPLAAVSRRARLGHGVCVGPGCAIAGGTNIADHAWLGAHCLIGHDCEIAEGATLAAGASLAGSVRIGRCAYVGTGASIRPGCAIGDGALVGMGAVVLHDVPPAAVVVGNPARRLERRPGG